MDERNYDEIQINDENIIDTTSKEKQEQQVKKLSLQDQERIEHQKDLFKSHARDMEYSLTMLRVDQAPRVHAEAVTLTKLHDEYGETYRDKSLFKSRESKIKNKKSRLYKKDQNAKRMEQLLAKRMKARDAEAKARMGLSTDIRKLTTMQEINDMSVLATLFKGQKESTQKRFDALLRSYAGITKDGNPADEQTKAGGRAKIIRQVCEKLLNTNLPTEQLMNDEYLTQKAEIFENTERLLTVYAHMKEANPGLFASMDKDIVKDLNERVNRLGDITAFYKVRKLIINNPYYRTHYNEELSMNADETDTPEKKLLAKLLRTSFYLGKNLQGFATMDANDLINRRKADQQDLIGENRTISPTLALPTTEYMKKAESEICLISENEEDYACISNREIDLLQKILAKEKKQSQISRYTKELREERRKVAQKEDRRVRRDKLLAELERENRYMIPADQRIDTRRVAGQKLTKEKLGFTLNAKDEVQKYHTIKYGTDKQVRLIKRLSKTVKALRGADMGVETKKLGKHIGGDKFARNVLPFSGMLTEELSEEETVELFENLMLCAKQDYSNSDEQTQAMIEDTYLNAYGKYLDLTYRMLKRTLNFAGDKFTYMSPEDIIRAMTPQTAEMLGNFLAIVGSVTQEMGFAKFMRLRGEEYAYLKNLYEVYSLVCYSANLTQGLTMNYKAQLNNRNMIPSRVIARRKDELRREITALETQLFSENASREAKDAYLKEGEEAEGLFRQGLTKKKIASLERQILERSAKLEMKDDDLYIMEHGKESDLHDNIFGDYIEGQRLYINQDENAAEEANILYAQVENAFSEVEDIDPKLIKENRTGRDEKDAYLRGLNDRRRVWQPYDKESVEKNLDDLGENPYYGQLEEMNRSEDARERELRGENEPEQIEEQNKEEIKEDLDEGIREEERITHITKYEPLGPSLDPTKAATYKVDPKGTIQRMFMGLNLSKVGEFKPGKEFLANILGADAINASGTVKLRGLMLSRVGTNMRGNLGEGQKPEFLLRVGNTLMQNQKMNQDKVEDQEEIKKNDAAFDKAMMDLKELYYVNLKRLEATYGKLLTQMHPMDIAQQVDPEKLRADFNILQDTEQMIADGKKYFDFEKNEKDKEFRRLSNYYNRAYTTCQNTFFAMLYNFDGNMTAELEKSLEEASNGTSAKLKYGQENEIGGPGMTKKQQSKYIRDLQKRAKTDKFEGTLFARFKPKKD